MTSLYGNGKQNLFGRSNKIAEIYHLLNVLNFFLKVLITKECRHPIHVLKNIKPGILGFYTSLFFRSDTALTFFYLLFGKVFVFVLVYILQR